MKSREIRAAFLEYFKSKGHTIVPGSPLIPRHDPTLLFVNAGMVQFKTFFLGVEKSPYNRAASCQKCLRAGGKHSDLENVGHTARHHTFFEMLGNFSFGDYFKKDAILFAWELLTEWFKLPKERLYVSVYEKDDEAAELWSELVGLPEERIARFGPKDNFWQMGDIGPCGPCSEIIIDQGSSIGCGMPDCAVGCECGRFLELWNLVFMQYNRDASGELTPLPKPSIDTGMGLERISAVLQGKINNFDSDIFRSVISQIEFYTKTACGKDKETDVSIRVIADHIRAIVFLLSEGLMPSNEGRGYVLRRIIRRASRHSRLLTVHEPFLYKLIDSVIDVLGDIYPEIVDERERTEKLLKTEEERFARTIEMGMTIFDEIISRVKRDGTDVIPGEEIFRLYDTYGFPLDLARDIAMDVGLRIDEKAFQREMEIQRERARASWIGEEEAVASVYRELISEIGETEFVGYENLESESVIKAILKNGKLLKEASEGAVVEVFLDKTPFYGESGGQVGDTGDMIGEDFRATVLDTKRPLDGFHSHIIGLKKGKLQVWDRVKCRVDAEKRKATMRNHTATHLLHAVLRSVLGDHLKQAGSLVSPEKLRFDFTHFSAPDEIEIQTIETLLNEKILENLPVVTSVMDIKTAIESGATALFGERYGKTVRVVNVPGFTSELCGGTHCKATGEIGLFVILSEGSIASGIRRIEALTGNTAFIYLKQKKSELDALRALLKTEKPLERVERLLNDMKSLEKEIQKLKTTSRDVISEALKEAHDLDGVKIVKIRQDGLNPKELRLLADNIRERLQSCIIVAASVTDRQAAIVCMVTTDLKDRYNAGEIIKRISKIAGGSGGGRPEMAQGGTKEIEKLDKALESVYDIVKK
ncbi:MAG: alanine--tRNA ligase [Thermodesulfovibrionales bacterium]|nr:alanine--tRNA ligase [Thermodesulfovibrionales bacterium]